MRTAYYRTRITQYYKSYGLFPLLARAALHTFRLLFQYHRFHVFTNVSKPLPPCTPALAHLSCHTLGPEHLDALVAFYDAEDDSRKYNAIKDRLTRGDDCFAATHNGTLVSVTWGLHHEDHDPSTGLVLTPSKNFVVSSDVLTAPAYRGYRIRSFLMTHVLNEYNMRGVKILEAIDSANRSALRAVAKLEYTHIYDVLVLRILRITFQWRARANRHL